MRQSRLQPKTSGRGPLGLRPPVHPYRVLVTAILLPGFGHVLSGAPQRGMVLQGFMILMGWITWHLTTPDHSLVGRLAGGLFVYAVSIPDAYRIAKLRYLAFAARR